MQQPDDSYSITHEHLVRYIFRQLLPEEESQIEDYLDANPHEADIVEGMLQFCEEKGIRTREAFDQAWGEEMSGKQDNLIRNTTLSTAKPPLPNQWTWFGVLLFLLLAGGAFWIWGRINIDQSVGKNVSPKDTITNRTDTSTTTKDTSPQANTPETTGTSTPEARCRLSENERSEWLLKFIKEVSGYHTSAGGDPSKSWQDYLSTDMPDRESAFRKLQQMAKTDPEAMQPPDYYALGVLYLLFKRNPSEAIHFLEAAEGISRPDYNKFRLAAYLEQDNNKKARDWAMAQNIPQTEWPQTAGPCLK